jgi:hypothetical protein
VTTPRKWTREEIETEARGFDWSRVDALTDADIEQQAKTDPDAVLPSAAELAGFDLVIPARHRRKPPEAAE